MSIKLSLTRRAHILVSANHRMERFSNAPINVKPLGGRPGIGGGFDSSHRPVVGTFDRFNDVLMTFLATFY